MNSNYNNVSTSSTAVKAGNNNEYILYAFMALAVVGCFLPFLSMSAYGLKESMNYVYYNDKLKDGVYVIALLIVAFAGIIKKKNYKGAIAWIGIALGILALDFFDIQGQMDELTYYGLVDVSYGIGFYLVAIGLIGSIVMAFIVNKNASTVVAPMSNVNVTVNPVPQPMPQPVAPQATVAPQQPLKCQYCGRPRNEGMFCKSCGGKY
jgi:hypothetical protein